MNEIIISLIKWYNSILAHPDQKRSHLTIQARYYLPDIGKHFDNFHCGFYLSCTCCQHASKMLAKCPNVKDFRKVVSFCNIFSKTDTKIPCWSCVGLRSTDRPSFMKEENPLQTSKKSFGNLIWFLHKKCTCKSRIFVIINSKLKLKKVKQSLTPKIALQMHHICWHAHTFPHLPLVPPLIPFLLNFSFFCKIEAHKKIWGDT